MINLIIKEKEELFDLIAQEYKKVINERPSITLGLATGSSPITLYNNLAKMYENNELSFKEVQTFNLDEYLVLDKNDKNSYFSFMNANLFSKIDIDLNNTHFPPTDESQIPKYEELLKDNPIDIQLLGIGTNGHIAFNEPGSSFDSRTRIVGLAQKTIEDNSRFFDHIEDVPTKASSMGLANIMEAKRIILIAVGESKAKILESIFKDETVDESIPATILKKHPNVTFYIDTEAAKYLNK